MYDVAEICRFHSANQVVLCPGSRCAPLTLAFSRTQGIQCYTIVDERSAAYIAMGIAETSSKTVVLVCTSGTAVLNFAPAIAEAFFKKIPLLVLTADRPQRMIGQQDGQTIFQQHVFGAHVKKSYSVSGDVRTQDETDYLHRIVNEALIISQQESKGPVHINISFEEPLYSLQPIEKPPRFITSLHGENITEILQYWNRRYTKWLVMPGAGFHHDSNDFTGINIPVLAEAISNHRGKNIISNANEVIRFAAEEGKAKLSPEVLITFGNGVVSKGLKSFIRNVKPAVHLHISSSAEVMDTYGCLTHVCALPENEVLGRIKELNISSEFQTVWMNFSEITQKRVDELTGSVPFSDLSAYRFATSRIPAGVLLHVGNSMAVRYLNLYSFLLPESVTVFCNRGTSGIDGTISTAVGTALVSEKPVWVFTGDLSFHYDGNALWNPYIPNNIRIVVFNNSGGGIFRLIDGSASVPEMAERFEARIQSSARHKAGAHGMDYYSASSFAELETCWNHFVDKGTKGKILEIFTDAETNSAVFNFYLKQLSQII